MVKHSLFVCLLAMQCNLSASFLLCNMCLHTIQSNCMAHRYRSTFSNLNDASTLFSKASSAQSFKLAHFCTQMKNSLSNSGENQDTSECFKESGPRLKIPEICIIVSKERMLAPGMTSCLHLYDLNNLAAIEEALSCGGLFSLVRL
jgi:hypothetical protein